MRSPNQMPCHITDERVPNDPQDARDDTRPEGCECRHQDEDGHDDPASEHDEYSERCPLYECDCGHAMQEHGSQGCEHEYGDINVGKEYEEAGGLCQCEMTPQHIRLRGRFGDVEFRVAEAWAKLMR